MSTTTLDLYRAEAAAVMATAERRQIPYVRGPVYPCHAVYAGLTRTQCLDHAEYYEVEGRPQHAEAWAWAAECVQLVAKGGRASL